MAKITDLNGNDLAAEKPVIIQLTFTPKNGRLEIGGDASSLDMTLNILAQAVRHFKFQYQANRMVALRNQVEQEEAVMSAANILSRRPS